MAEVNFDHFDGGYAVAPQGFGRWLNLGGTVLSLAIVVGAGVWGYQLAVRDVSGIPVIRAMGGPLRIAPDNPGGDVAMHQGLSVNAVAAAGTALPIPDSLRLAPREMTLLEEDVAGLALPEGVEAMVEDQVSALAATAPAVQPLEAAELPEALPETQEDAVALALAEALGEELPAPDSMTLSGDVAASPRPRARGAASTAEPAVVAPAEIDSASIAAGISLVQLGAFDDQEAARGEWARLAGKFGDLMVGKSMVVQTAESGGRTFFRLRAHGFADEDEARRFCTAMLAENATCIPVAQR